MMPSSRKRRPLALFAIAALLLIARSPAFAAPQDDGLIPHAQDRPPNPPKSPAEAIAAMTVPEGFAVELVASEPDLVNPVSMTFDEKGRIWVTESLEYPRREAGPGRDPVKVLEDGDGDGTAETVTIFAEGLNIPSGIAIGHGGVWVANSPDILFFPNADGDLAPDGPPEVVATGFGRDDTHELPNSLTWGPDGWLYGWNGVFNPSKVTSRNGQTYEFTCAIWRIHPRTREFQVWCEGTSNPWGIAINDDGEFFASACVIDHLWHLVEGAYYTRQGGPYPPFTYPQGSIVDHKHQKAAYCGIHWFDSDAYPEPYRRKLYMGNIHGNCINVDELERDGSTYKAKSCPDFLSANDAWFMPVSQKTGPDGCLYILDWYDRYHCYQDANRDPEGIDRLKGRLYRVRYKDSPRRAPFDLAAEPDQALIRHLASPNVYDRDIAQRLLAERLASKRAEQGTSTALQSLVFNAQADSNARMHALWAFVSGDPSNEAFLSRLLVNDDPRLRAWGARAAGDLGEQLPEPLRWLIYKLALDHEPAVRLQTVIAIPKILKTNATALLFRQIGARPDDPLLFHVRWQKMAPGLGDSQEVEQILNFTLESPGALKESGYAVVWPRLVDRLSDTGSVAPALLGRISVAALQRLPREHDARREILDILTRRIRENALQGERLKDLREVLHEHVRPKLDDPSEPIHVDYVELAGAWGDPEALHRLRATLSNDDAHHDARLEALQVLIARQDLSVLDSVSRVLADADAPRPVRQRMLAALGSLDSPRVAEVVLQVYPKLDDNLQFRAIELLTTRPHWSKALLAQVERKAIPPSEVNVNQVRRLQASKDPELTRFVRALWGTVREGRNERRELVVSQMRHFLARTPSDPVAGQAVYQKLCGQCHKIYGEGEEVGPDITLNGRNDFDQLISNVFDPNLVIGPVYQATNVATRDGRVLTGLLAEDSPERVVLKLQGGKLETIPRGDVEEIALSPISLMPEDMENQLTPQEIADLFAFLALDKPPNDPTARRLPGAPDPKSLSGSSSEN
jgi:putative heme-binding domain-containing protein